MIRTGKLAKSFVEGKVSFTGRETDGVPVKMLSDTASAQIFVLSSIFPFSNSSYCGTDVLVQGTEMGHLKLPLHPTLQGIQHAGAEAPKSETVTIESFHPALSSLSHHWLSVVL